ncbi:hypothetical protein L0V05_03420 [Tabrizicola sp. J26]|uniref:NYN domain-containing protein n=1 Tax=Alitabrizicola rongguiensis TaxID=2909234 RepID=UPI001F2FD6A0|nr:hypothetical protein [Tabrizicola rongguiensis]MCF1707862.1 hypothetical protein [Tabrizicola rongguiensis]
MVVPVVLLLLSLAGVGIALTLPDLSALLILAGPCAIGAAILVLWAAWPNVAPPDPVWIVVDGSNVMYWKDNAPRLETVQEVLLRLKALGFSPGVVFDANAGYLLTGRYMHHEPFSRLLDLPEDRVMVVSKGTVADMVVLAAARDLGARIVSNDRYRDWAEQHPEIADPGRIVRGGYREGALWLDLDRAA